MPSTRTVGAEGGRDVGPHRPAQPGERRRARPTAGTRRRCAARRRSARCAPRPGRARRRRPARASVRPRRSLGGRDPSRSARTGLACTRAPSAPKSAAPTGIVSKTSAARGRASEERRGARRHGAGPALASTLVAHRLLPLARPGSPPPARCASDRGPDYGVTTLRDHASSGKMDRSAHATTGRWPPRPGPAGRER